jgi:hypothetical protein
MKTIDYLEVHWWIKDSTKRGYVRGIDIIKDINIADLKLISLIESLDDFDKSWALNCLQEYGSSCYSLPDKKKEEEHLFSNFLTTLFDVVDEPLDFGVSKVKKIYIK